MGTWSGLEGSKINSLEDGTARRYPGKTGYYRIGQYRSVRKSFK